ncbi:MAG: acyl-CoA reductase [Bacteroidales bacterium]|nr:acyl-CoA reductase [Bacteroidales bacterium]
MSQLSLHQRIDAFVQLGIALRNIAADQPSTWNNSSTLQHLIQTAVYDNPWFTPENVRFAFQSIGNSLTESNFQQWLQPYTFPDNSSPKTIGVVMAGNIPLVGFHDLLCVLISGHRLLAKTASGDARLTTTLAQLLMEIEPNFSENITFTDSLMKNCNAYIATGSDNSARYFDSYFGKYPHIIRAHRNSVAVLQGNETDEEIVALADDVFRYYGLGCRNVSKLFIPQDFDLTKMLQLWESQKTVNNNLKYFHNYTYQKTIYLVNNEVHLDNGFLLLKKAGGFSAPIAVLYYEPYEKTTDIQQLLAEHRHLLQCVVSHDTAMFDAVAFGKAQQPDLWDYADGVDTMAFLLSLNG